MTHLYTAYGLTISLPFECPLLQPAVGAGPDVVLEYGAVPRALATAVARNDAWANGCPWQADATRLLVLGGRRAGRFLVEGGTRITLERNPDAEDARIAHLLVHIVLAGVLQQRGFLVLHANAVKSAGGAVAISGASGAGKSTTLAALQDRGWAVLSDDVTAIRLSATGTLEVLPGAPQLYLCEDAAEGLGRGVAGLQRNPYRRSKVVVPTVAEASPAPLRALILLEATDGAEMQCTALHGADKFLALQECLYWSLSDAKTPAWFPALARLAAQASVLRIRRPKGQWTVDQVVEKILSA